VAETDLQKVYREHLGLRIGPEMAAYVERQLAAGEAAPIFVIGQDARTGAAVRKPVEPAHLLALLAAPAVLTPHP